MAINIEKIVAISGRQGLFRMISNRSNGLVVEDLDSGKTFFVSGRVHQFTPLESISIYTENAEGTTELKTVLQNMQAKAAELPPVNPNASGDSIRSYFEQILPEFHRDKVLISDIKKIIKWFNFLIDHKLID